MYSDRIGENKNKIQYIKKSCSKIHKGKGWQIFGEREEKRKKAEF